MTLNLIRRVAEIVRPPRSAFLPFPFGAPVGNPGDEDKQIRVLRAALGVLEKIQEPGGIVDLPLSWK